MKLVSLIAHLNYGVADLRAWQDREAGQHAIWVLLLDLGSEKRSHARASSSSNTVKELNALWTVAALHLCSQAVKALIYQLGTFSIEARTISSAQSSDIDR